jgi:hypothetical protein
MMFGFDTVIVQERAACLDSDLLTDATSKPYTQFFYELEVIYPSYRHIFTNVQYLDSGQ